MYFLFAEIVGISPQLGHLAPFNLLWQVLNLNKGYTWD